MQENFISLIVSDSLIMTQNVRHIINHINKNILSS